MATKVSAAFDELLGRQRLTDDQQRIAQTRIGTLGTFFQNNFEMNAAVFPIGSYARRTICASERDIDLMATFNPFGSEGYWERYKDDSRAFLYWVRSNLNDRYATTNVSSRQVAVKLDFTSIVAEVVPCFPRKGGGYLMPNGKGKWMATNPPFHAQLIADADKAKGNKLKPLIRLIKFWNIANGHHLSSFHVEMLVKDMWEKPAIGEWSSTVSATLKVMGSWVKTARQDPWPDGSGLDSYLSDDIRQQVIRMLDDDAKAAEQAEAYCKAGREKDAFERWGVIYRHKFPAYS